MSRSGYSDDYDGWASIRYRGAVKSAINGKRGQQALREILAALDAMPEKSLAAESLVTADGEYCTLGALGAARGMNLDALDPEDHEGVAEAFGLAPAMVREIVYENDEYCEDEREYFNVDIVGPMRPWERHRQLRWRTSPFGGARRWSYMRAWVARNIKADA